MNGMAAFLAAGIVNCRMLSQRRRGHKGNWTTRGYANSRIANSRTGQHADVAGSSCSLSR